MQYISGANVPKVRNDWKPLISGGWTCGGEVLVE